MAHIRSWSYGWVSQEPYSPAPPSVEGAIELFLRREDAERVVRDWDREPPEPAGLLPVGVIGLETSAN
jgi:hypothetical protein